MTKSRVPFGVAAVLSAVLILALSPFPADRALAVGSCPVTTNGPVDDWDALYLGDAWTLCQGEDGLSTVAYVQILDLNEGAKISVVSEATTEIGHTDTEFQKRSVASWFDEIEEGNIGETPAEGFKLFSVTNAGFFETHLATTSALSFPEKVSGTIQSYGALADEPDTNPYRCASKQAFMPHDPWSYYPDIVPQAITMHYNPLPGCYTEDDVDSFMGSSGYDATIGLYAGGNGTSDDDRRTHVYKLQSAYHNKVYIITTDEEVTNSQVTQLMSNFLPYAVPGLRLDGGASASFYSEWGSMSASSPFGVAEVLAVYIPYEE